MASIFQGSRKARAGMQLESNNPVMQGGEGIEYFKAMNREYKMKSEFKFQTRQMNLPLRKMGEDSRYYYRQKGNLIQIDHTLSQFHFSMGLFKISSHVRQMFTKKIDFVTS